MQLLGTEAAFVGVDLRILLLIGQGMEGGGVEWSQTTVGSLHRSAVCLDEKS
jgi:hypothetical protein